MDLRKSWILNSKLLDLELKQFFPSEMSHEPSYQNSRDLTKWTVQILHPKDGWFPFREKIQAHWYSFIVSSTEQWANNLCVSKGSVFCLAGKLSNHLIFLFIHFLSTGKFLFQVRKLEVAQQYDFTIEAFFVMIRSRFKQNSKPFLCF